MSRTTKYAVYDEYNNFKSLTNYSKRLIKISILSVLLLILLPFSIVANDEREAAVITRFGKVKDIKGAGWHFKFPLIDGKIKYRTDVQSSIANADAATKDQQSVNISVQVNYRIDGENIDNLYRTVKDPTVLAESIIPPIIQESAKSVSAQYSAVGLIDNRDEVKIRLIGALQTRLDDYYVKVVTVNIEDLRFSKIFDQAIENKMVTQQEVEKKKQELEKAKLDKEIATEEAEATRIKGEALQQNPEYIELELIKKWDGKLPIVSSDGNIIDVGNLIK